MHRQQLLAGFKHVAVRVGGKVLPQLRRHDGSVVFIGVPQKRRIICKRYCS